MPAALARAACDATPPADRASCAIELPAPSGAAAPPAEILLIPAGEVRTRPHDGRAPFHNLDPQAIVAATRELGLDIPVDYDHGLEHVDTGARGIAAGWINDVFVRDGAIWGKVEWTATATKHLAEREYRFISPVFQFDKATRAIKRVLSAALTNDPALYMRAIASAHHQTEPEMDELLKALAAALGLAEGSDANAITAAIEKLQADAVKATAAAETMTAVATVLGMKDAEPKAIGEKVGELVKAAAAAKTDSGEPDPTKFVPIDEYKALAARVEKIEGESTDARATAAVNQAVEGGKVTPGSRDWALAYAKKDPDGFDAFVKAQPVLVKDGALLPGIAPAGGKDGALTADEKAACKALGISEEDFKKTRDQEVDE